MDQRKQKFDTLYAHDRIAFSVGDPEISTSPPSYSKNIMSTNHPSFDNLGVANTNLGVKNVSCGVLCHTLTY